MENFIIGLFSQQLETYIEGFRKEQVTANLLNGKGEISQVNVKVKPVNDILKRYTHLVELSSVYISKLSFNVTSLRNIKKAPIEIFIDEVHVVLVEPLEYCGPNAASWPMLAKSIVERAKKKGPYGLMERIQDNITLDINRIYVTFQPMGKFKTRRMGEWTPPAISFVLNYLRYVSVDEYGDEASPDEVWRHNTRIGREEALLRKQILGLQIRHQDDRRFWHRTLMIYKKLTVEVSVAIGYRSTADMSAKESFYKGHLILANVPLQSHFCIHRRIRNNAILAVQIDVSFLKMEWEVSPEIIPLIVHALVGIQNCFKRQSFKDPFEQRDPKDSLQATVSAMPTQSANLHVYDEMDLEGNGSKMEFSSEESDSEGSSGDEEGMGPTHVSQSSTNNQQDHEVWPALVLPAGLIITDKIGFSLSIHHFDLRIRYSKHVDSGHLQVSMKGLVSEVIWPKSRDGVLGGYVQLSLAYIHIQEKMDNVAKRILLGGHQVSAERKLTKVTTAEEMFPMFEHAYIRIDPDDFRSTFPVQVFGLKVSFDVIGKEFMIKPTTQFSITNEIGINDVHITLVPEALFRLHQAVEQGSQDIDHRWFSGDWATESRINDIEKFIYVPPVGNDLVDAISPRNVNITARICDLEVVIPPVTLADNTFDDANLLVSMTEMTLLMSSSLPRMFLSTDIHLTNEESNTAAHRFPNKPTDCPYQNVNDLSQTIRLQTTLTGVCVKYVSPFSSSHESQVQTLFKASKLTILSSLEDSEQSIRGSMIHIFICTLLQDVNINADFKTLSRTLKILLGYRTIVDSTKVPMQNPLSKCNVILRVSMNTATVNSLIYHHSVNGINDERRKEEDVPVASLLTIHAEGSEMSMHLSPGDNGDSMLLLCKGENSKLSVFSNDISADKNDQTYFELWKASTDTKNYIFSFGNDEDMGSIQFRFEVGGLGVLQGAAVISNGDIYLTDKVFGIFSNIIDAVRWYDWPIPKQNIASNHQTSDIDIRLNFLSSLFWLTPSHIDFLNFSFQMKNVKIYIPHTKTGNDFGLAFEDLGCHIGYRIEGNIPQHFMEGWEKLYQDDIRGFHHVLSSRIKCFTDDKRLASSEVLGSFEFHGYLHPSNLKWETQDFVITFDDLSLLKDLNDALSNTHKCFRALSHNFVKSFDLQPKSFFKHDENGKQPLLQLCDVTIHDISRARCRLLQAKDDVNQSRMEQNRELFESKRELERLRNQVVSSELKRLAALSLVSHEMSGFLRVSSTMISGQRFVSATSFWSYFVVLRKGHLIMLKDSTHEKPCAVISVDGASIRSVVGSGAKHIFSKAFAIVESNGKETFFLAPSFAAAEKWIDALTSTTTVTSHQKLTSFSAETYQVSETSVQETPIDRKDVNLGTENVSSIVMDSIEQKSSTDSYNASDNISFPVSEDESDDIISRGSKGSKFRDRMAKIKTSVRNNVKSMNENVKNIKMERSVNPVFPRGQTSSSHLGVLSMTDIPLKLKRVRATQEEPQTKEKIKITGEQKLMLLPGIWNCSVSLDRSAVANAGERDMGAESNHLHELQFTLYISQEMLSTEQGPIKTKLEKSFLEIFHFHSTVLEIISAIEKDPHTAEIDISSLESVTNDLFPQIISSGKALHGLMQLKPETITSSFKYLEMSTSDFFRTLLSFPIPTMVFNLLADFLDLKKITPDIHLSHSNRLYTCINKDLYSNHIGLESISERLVRCDMELEKSENLIRSTRNLVSLHYHQKKHALSNDKTTSKDHSSSIPETHQIIIDKLMSAMVERDAIHSSLVGSTVRHAHELECERKRFQRLRARLKSVEELSDRNSAPAALFFLGQPTIPDVNSLSKKNRDMIQDVEEELRVLCEQLSSAISSRASAELEITRIEEIHRTKEAILNSEISKLKEELLQVRKQVQEESFNRRKAEEECRMWRESFEALLHSKPSSL